MTTAARRNASALNTNGPASSPEAVPGDRGLGERRQEGPGHRADRRRPDDQRQLPAATRRLGEVDRRVPGLKVGRGPAAEEEQAHEEQRHGVGRRRRHDHRGPDRSREVRQPKPGRRPPRPRISRVTGMARSAAPTTAALWARPETPTPAMPAASSAPTESPIATPLPPIICVVTRTDRVRRCTRPTRGADRTGRSRTR